MPYAIKITNLSKTFKIPTEKQSSLRERFVNLKLKTSYRPLPILKNISFQVKKGEWLGIIGKNGSGKSTLLKLINNIYEPDKGKIEVNGYLIPFLELGVGFNPELSAHDNIFLNGTILGMTRKQIKRKYQSIVNFAGIKPFIHMKLKNFSSGMNVRLGFSVAIQAPGDIFLLDEILAVGDYEFQHKTQKIFKKMKKMEKTVVLVTHNLKDVQNFCNRCIWLNKGKIAAIGDPKNVVDKYTSSENR